MSDGWVEQGNAALAEGRWDEARRAFEAALAERESAEALAGMGEALWWLCEAQASVRYRERAYAKYRRAGDISRACRIAVDLSISYLGNLGNDAAAGGWLGRAERIIEESGSEDMRGWLWLMRGYMSGDAQEAETMLRRALDFARGAGDPDLELVALGDLGLALVTAGRAEEGTAMLDEAAAATFGGEPGRLDTVVYTSCSMLAACSLLGDLERAAQWCRVADDFMATYSCPFLFARCRVHYGSVLVAKGDWERAETELQSALRMSEDAGPGARTEAAVRLADLRVRQGRFEEAEAILKGCDDILSAAQPAAALRLAHGEAAAACALLERRLKALGEDHIEAAPTLALLVDAEIARGNLDAAEKASDRLAVIASRGPHEDALAVRAAAHLAGARGRSEDALAGLEGALEKYTHLDLPLETAHVRLELARALAERAPDVAALEARRALVAFEQLGAAAHADETAALLRSLGAVGRDKPRSPGALTKREQEVLGLVGAGLTNPEIAARLFISRKTAAHHVSSVLAKLGLRNRAEAVAYAARAGQGKLG